MNLSQAIAALLYEHDTVIVPALGAFVRHDESARVNVITNEFQRPGSSLGFDPTQHEENPLLIEYLMQHDELPFEEVRQQIAAFVADAYAKMREGEPLVLDGIGTLSLNRFQELEFEPDSSADFNAEAFGLVDLDAQPVFGDTQDSASDKSLRNDLPDNDNGQSTDGDDDPHHSHWWLWLLLILLILGGGVSLWYFNLWPFNPKPLPPVVVDTVAVDTSKTIISQEIIEDSISDSIESLIDSTLVPLNPLDSLASDSLPQHTDTMPEQNLTEEEPKPVVEEPKPTVKEPDSTIEGPVPTTPTIQVVKPLPESKAFVVGGCFSVEQNALNMAKEAIEKGCAEAFVMKRGSKFFVCYGQYPSTADAKAALPEILTQYNPKAWILTK